MFSSENESPGTTHAIIKQKLLPPIQCLRSDVSLESLYGA
jgi:hypothetical protein